MKAIHVLTLVLVLSLLTAGLALASWPDRQDRQGSPMRPREVLSGGASNATAAGGVSLQGTLGQPLVGVVSGSGGDLTLAQGFWHGAPAYRIYLPLATRGG
jgi:uncharacterized iron-regulated membrane protein